MVDKKYDTEEEADEGLEEQSEWLTEIKERIEQWKHYLQVGDVYMDSFGHPVLCTKVDIESEDIGLTGISLFDGSYPRQFSLLHEDINRISIEEAWQMKLKYEKSKGHILNKKKKFCEGERVLVAWTAGFHEDCYGTIIGTPQLITNMEGEDYYYWVKFDEPLKNLRYREIEKVQILSCYLWKLD